MINCNGSIVLSQTELSTNRGFLYGDSVFETLKIVNNTILFFEDHYFRLMASMRIVRMKIPDNFTMEYIEEQILNLVASNSHQESARVRLSVYRNDGGFYAPKTNTVSFIITSKPLENKVYEFLNKEYEVDLYKDFFITKQLLSTLKTNNKIINVTASIYAQENNLKNCILLNEDKNVVEAINGNIFLVKNNQIITPPIGDGCLNGIMRKQVISICKQLNNIELLEQSISAFDLQKADELFITNIIVGIQPITKYRKKEFATHFSKQIIDKVNVLI